VFSETIAAIASPSGKGALSVIRVSGSQAVEIASRVIRSFDSSTARTTRLAQLSHPVSEEVLDQVLYAFYPNPRSFTGEDLVEITTHGGLFVPVDVLEALLAAGARQARPGEFSMRAVVNGKLDLLQAEAVGDLVDSTAPAQRAAALSQLARGLSRRIETLRTHVLELEGLLSYEIDFPEEDDGPVSQQRIDSASELVLKEVTSLLDTSRDGERLREGALVVIAGVPNSGKSSLFNSLVGFDRAIVTEIAGTTRDAIEAPVSCSGFPFRLIDTAGIRKSDDTVEKLGIEVSKRYVSAADIVIFCVEVGRDQTLEERKFCEELGDRLVLVNTKADLISGKGKNAGLWVSVIDGSGLPDLREALAVKAFGSEMARADLAPALTRARHRTALEKARVELSEFSESMANGVEAVVASVHLRAAVLAMEEIIGVVTTEDVLESVFSSFCIGK
jgi:tRNA modification GTPase